MVASTRTAFKSDPFQKVATLSAAERTILRVKALVEFPIDPELPEARIKDTEARLAALMETLPPVAWVHAEILAKISGRPAPYKESCAPRRIAAN